MSTHQDEDRLHDLGVYFRPREARKAGLSYDRLRGLERSGHVERVGWGLYRRCDLEPTELHTLAEVCARSPSAIVCLLSALQVHGIGSRVPAAVWIAVANKARPPGGLGVGLELVRFSGPALEVGVDEAAFEGVRARITSPARTVVDCFRLRRRIGREAAREALYDSLQQRKVTVDALYRTLELLPSTSLRATLEAMP